MGCRLPHKPAAQHSISGLRPQRRCPPGSSVPLRNNLVLSQRLSSEVCGFDSPCGNCALDDRNHKREVKVENSVQTLKTSLNYALLQGKNAILCTAIALAALFAAMPIRAQAQTLSTVYDFVGSSNSQNPQGVIAQGRDGNYYGMTTGPEPGTIYNVSRSGAFTLLHSMVYADGQLCNGLVLGTDGNFYGTCFNGGNNGNSTGTFFQVTPTGTLTVLHYFDGLSSGTSDGCNPEGVPMQATDGNFYGTAKACGLYNGGMAYKITTAGAFTPIHAFAGGTTDAQNPQGALIQGSDGNLWGTSYAGGPTGSGTVYKMTTAGNVTVVYQFEACGLGTTGCNPAAGLVQGTDGNYYGTALSGGTNNQGVVFKVTPGGAYTVLHNFKETVDNGGYPELPLTVGTDGNFYGIATGCFGGGCSNADIFKITSEGVFTDIYNFPNLGGNNNSIPETPLLLGTDGAFYGTTYEGTNSAGSVFSLSVGLGPFVETQPTSGMVGATVIILGTNLTSATSVTFNGTAATFNVISDSEITSNVPAGATTGLVQVTGTPSGTLTSNATFVITTPVQFASVTPCRLVDTRPQYGGSGPIQGGTFESFDLAQLAQNKGCADLSSAGAYSLNVTVVPQGSLGYLTVWPTGEIMPYVSSMNSPDGRVKANAVIVPSGSNSVSVFASDTTNVVIDIDGYFEPASQSTLAFYPLTPCRVADTRKVNGDLGGPHLKGGQDRDFPVLESSCIPAGVNPVAYSFNFTAVPYPALGYPLGYLTAYATGQPLPNVSTLNNPTGTVVANAAIVPAGIFNGEISVFPSGDTDLVIDINGYFAPPGGQNALSLYPVAPCRVLDTRKGSGLFIHELTVNVVGSPCAPPSSAQAYVFNATVVPSGSLGYLTLWPDGSQQPGVSTLNALDGAITSNMAIVPTNNGEVDAYASDVTQLILDISSYFAP